MSSGYSSLEEDSEEYFTARTSLFKRPSFKPTNLKVKMIKLIKYSIIHVFIWLI